MKRIAIAVAVIAATYAPVAAAKYYAGNSFWSFLFG